MRSSRHRAIAGALAAILLAVTAGFGASATALRDSHAVRVACTRPDAPRMLVARRFVFPQDGGAHDGYASEWWRTFGRLVDTDGKYYDVSVNVSRFAIASCDEPIAKNRWAATHIVTTTYAILEEDTRRIERDASVEREGVLGANADTHELSLRSKLATYTPKTSSRAPALTLRVEDDGHPALTFDQMLRPPAVALGPGGVMRTGSCSECAAYAYAFMNNATHGSLRFDGAEHRVSFFIRIEHEFAQRELGPHDAGWNRFELQFDDGRQLDARFTRNAAGDITATSGIFIDLKGTVHYLGQGDASAPNVKHTVWRSTASRTTYPSLWFLDVPSANLGLATVETALDQEHAETGRVPYFWGAVDAERLDSPPGDYAHGFVELTGYNTPASL